MGVPWPVGSFTGGGCRPFPAVHFGEVFGECEDAGMVVNESVCDRIATTLFVIGLAPGVVLGMIASLFVPQGTLAEWFVFGMSLSSYAVLFVSVVAGFILGGVLAAPFWITARIMRARARTASRQTVTT